MGDVNLSILRQQLADHYLLVHVYGRVDNRLVYQVIQEDLEYLDAFQQANLNWMGI